jgi:cytochrome c
MRKRRAILVVGLGFCSAISTVDAASAQIPSPAIKPPDGAALFKQQCATCHATNLSDVPRQGPPLVQVIGRQAGKVEGFHYSSGLARAGFTWDEARLDAWLTDPQAVIPGAIMPYRQAKAETRAAIITYLKGLN